MVNQSPTRPAKNRLRAGASALRPRLR